MQQQHPYSESISWPCGELVIVASDTHLLHIELFPQNYQSNKSNSNQIIANTKQQLKTFWQDNSFKFDLPLEVQGTDFQKRVWQALREIPTGQVETYGSLAKKLQSSPRAIGQACRTNPIAIVIPCHRVVSQTSLGGFAGETDGNNLDVKQWLLQHEESI